MKHRACLNLLTAAFLLILSRPAFAQEGAGAGNEGEAGEGEAAPPGEEALSEEETVVEEVEDEAPEEEPEFDYVKAVTDVTDMLMSAETNRLLKECFEKWTLKTEIAFPMVVQIDPKGKVAQVKLPAEVTPVVGRCITDELANLPFVPSPQGLTAGAHYDFKIVRDEGGKEVEGKAAEGEAVVAAEGPLKDPASNRLFYHQTAFTTPRKTVRLTFVDAGNFHLSAGLSDYFDINVNTMPPVTVWGLGLFPKVAFNLHEKVRLGFIPSFGLFMFMFDTDLLWLMYGLTPVMSIGSEDFCFNMSLHILAFSWWAEGGHNGFLTMVPGIGAGIRVARNLKLNIELMAPQLARAWGENEWNQDFRMLDGVNTINGKLWFIMIGLRVFGRKFYADFGLAWAIFPGWWDFQVFIPVGWPVFSFGIQL